MAPDPILIKVMLKAMPRAMPLAVHTAMLRAAHPDARSYARSHAKSHVLSNAESHAQSHAQRHAQNHAPPPTHPLPPQRRMTPPMLLKLPESVKPHALPSPALSDNAYKLPMIAIACFSKMFSTQFGTSSLL